MKQIITIVFFTLVFCVSAFAQDNIRNVNFQNFTYDADYCGGDGERKITVKDGKFIGEKKIDDYTERIFFSIFDLAFGDLDGDKVDEAVILSVCNTGGTGNFSEAYIYKLENGKPVKKMTMSGGDRAYGGLRKARIKNGLLIIESSDPGEYGGNCCAELVVTNTYRFNGKTLDKVGKSTSREIYPAARVSFDRGAFGKKILVKMSPDEQRRRFVVGAAADQTLMVTHDSDAKLRLRSGDAQVLEEGTGLVAKLNKTGDYVFEVDDYSETKKEFTLSITIKNTGYTYVQADDGKIESIYTDLSAEKCKTIEVDDSGAGSYTGECKGVGGYKLELLEGDLRQTLNLVREGSGEKWELELWSVVSSAFSALGDKAEWRVKKENGVVKPLALIVRYNASEDPSDSSKITSYLVVSKIAGESVCVTDIVKPVKGQNLAARIAADNSASKPCLTRR